MMNKKGAAFLLKIILLVQISVVLCLKSKYIGNEDIFKNAENRTNIVHSSPYYFINSGNSHDGTLFIVVPIGAGIFLIVVGFFLWIFTHKTPDSPYDQLEEEEAINEVPDGCENENVVILSDDDFLTPPPPNSSTVEVQVQVEKNQE